MGARLKLVYYGELKPGTYWYVYHFAAQSVYIASLHTLPLNDAPIGIGLYPLSQRDDGKLYAYVIKGDMCWYSAGGEALAGVALCLQNVPSGCVAGGCSRRTKSAR